MQYDNLSKVLANVMAKHIYLNENKIIREIPIIKQKEHLKHLLVVIKNNYPYYAIWEFPNAEFMINK